MVGDLDIMRSYVAIFFMVKLVSYFSVGKFYLYHASKFKKKTSLTKNDVEYEPKDDQSVEISWRSPRHLDARLGRRPSVGHGVLLITITEIIRIPCFGSDEIS